MPGDRGGVEEGERHDARDAGHQAGQRVDLDEMPVDPDAGAADRLGVGADRVGVAAEPRLGEYQPEGHRHRHGEDDEPRDRTEELTQAERLDQGVGRAAGNVVAGGDDLREAQGGAQAAEGHDERGYLRLRDQHTLNRTPGGTGQHADQHPDEDHRPAGLVPAVVHHELGRQYPGQDQYRAVGQVDAAGDDDVGHPDAEHQVDGRVGGDLRDVVLAEEGTRRRRDREERDQRDKDRERPRAVGGEEATGQRGTRRLLRRRPVHRRCLG